MAINKTSEEFLKDVGSALKVRKNLDKALSDGVLSPAELLVAMRAMMEVYDERFGGLKDEVDIKAEDNIIKLDEAIDDATKSVDDLTASTKKDVVEKFDIIRNKLEQDLKDLEEKIPGEFDIDPFIRQMQEAIDAVKELIPDPPEPLTAEEIRDELETLEDEERLDASAIKGLRKFTKDVFAKMKVGSGSSTPIANWARHEEFAMDGILTSVTLSQGVGAAGNAIIARYQGQTLDMTTHYTVNGNKITLVGFTPEDETVISITYWP